MPHNNSALALLLLSGLAIHWLIPATAWFMLRGKNDRLSNLWFGGAALYALVVSLFIFRNWLPLWVLGPGASTLSVVAFLCFGEALRCERSNTATPWTVYAGITASVAAILLILLSLDLYQTAGRSFHLVVVAGIDGWVAYCALRVARQHASRALWVVVVVFFIGAATNLARGLEFPLTGDYSDLLSFRPIGNLGLMVNYLAGIFYCYGYWGFVLEKNRNRLVQATAASVAAREREQLAVEREHMTERIAAISQMAQSGAVSAAIAHEINQPLAAMRLDVAQVQTLARQLDPDHPLHKPLTRIGRDAVRIAEIVQRMRQLFVHPPSQTVLEYPDEVVGKVVGLMQTQLQKARVQVKLDLHGPRHAHIASGELEHVLLNLMHNAIEAFALAKTPTPQLHIQTWQADKCLYLSCADNGPGVPAQAQSSIFDMQYSTKPNNLGVGLWLSRYIVERHGGKLWLDETADQGARFVARIPAA